MKLLLPEKSFRVVLLLVVTLSLILEFVVPIQLAHINIVICIPQNKEHSESDYLRIYYSL
jgi:hypothetical protein